MEKEINVDDVVKFLSRAFSKAVSNASNKLGNRAVRAKNRKGCKYQTTPLYDYQVEFCYLIDNIQRCPIYIMKKNIQLANDFIVELEALSES